jgi:hypothetical protein
MTMTILACKALLPPTSGKAKGSLVMLTVLAAVIILVDLPLARAESVPAVVSAAKPGPKSTKPPRAAAESVQSTKRTAAKSKPRPRVAPKSAKPTPAPVAKPTPPPAAKPTQVMGFDTDEVEGQRLEPGFDLIQASPRRARHQSMVPFPPKPEDSVVKGN